VESIQLSTPDGHVLGADLVLPEAAPRGGVIVCHPHPAFGGNRFNSVVEALYLALPMAGFVALRFDFRTGAGEGVAERLDVVAAIDALVERIDAPVSVAGYSFGAAVALATADERITAIAAIAPPLSMMPSPEPTVPCLVLTPRHDQFCPPDAARPIVESWSRCDYEVIESADHFLTGRTTAVAQRAVDWLATHC
jgi:alpha/beta superfamily hydrolase